MKCISTFACLSILLCLSCTDVIEVNLDEGAVHLVVEGRLELIKASSFGYQSIRLTTTAPYFSNEPAPAARGARVAVSVSGRTYPFTESATVPGLYETDSLYAEVDQWYTLSIDWEGDHYEGTEQLAPVAAIDSIYQIFAEETVFDEAGIRVRIDYVDPPDEENYYYWLMYKNGEYLLNPNPGTRNDLLSSDEFYDGQKIIGKEPNTEVTLTAGDTVLVRQIGLTEAAFVYHDLLYEQTGGTGFVETPSTPIRGNIRNMTRPTLYPLGYFRASEVSEARLVIQ
jgi:hypothetical protein